MFFFSKSNISNNIRLASNSDVTRFIFRVWNDSIYKTKYLAFSVKKYQKTTSNGRLVALFKNKYFKQRPVDLKKWGNQIFCFFFLCGKIFKIRLLVGYLFFYSKSNICKHPVGLKNCCNQIHFSRKKNKNKSNKHPVGLKKKTRWEFVDCFGHRECWCSRKKFLWSL